MLYVSLLCFSTEFFYSGMLNFLVARVSMAGNRIFGGLSRMVNPFSPRLVVVTGPCTLNAVGLLSLDVETRGSPPLAPPPRVVWRSLPYLTYLPITSLLPAAARASPVPKRKKENSKQDRNKTHNPREGWEEKEKK